MSASEAVQVAVIAALRADEGVAALVGSRVYDVPPPSPEYPFISLGPTSFIPERRDCRTGRTETVQIDIWSRVEMRSVPAKRIMDAVVDALDTASLSLADPHAAERCELLLARLMRDPDGITTHGVLQFEIEASEPA